MPSKFTSCSLLVLCCAAWGVHAAGPADKVDQVEKEASTRVAPAATASSSATSSVSSSAFDGVIGLTSSYRPKYPGAPKRALHTTPAFYLRWGRLTVTNASGFAPRRGEDVARGLGLDMLRGDRLAVSLSLRYDSGRSEGSSEAYAGLGNIRHTVRARLAASWALGGPWRLGASWNSDVLGRGNGGVGDVSAGWETRVGPRSIFSVASYLSLADARYMQAYYGITAAQSARSVYAPFDAKAGLRDMGVSASLRHDFAGDWVALANVGATRLLGSAADSPITRNRNGWSVGGGLGWRF